MTALQAARQRVEDYIASEPKPDPLRLHTMIEEIIIAARVHEQDPF